MARFVPEKGRAAVLGGSFNPVHKGHLAMADFLLGTLGFDMVVLMPVYKAPHKTGRKTESFYHRFAMLRLATSGTERIRLTTIEKSMPEPNYSYLTLRRLSGLCDGFRLHFIMGHDMFLYLPHWKNQREIIETYPLVIFNRNDESLAETYDVLRQQYHFCQEPEFVADFDFKVSSTEIRQTLAKYYIEKEPGALRNHLAEQLAPSTLNYILKNRLYANEKH